ncbi:uncharacterized protein LOC123872797 [Maniola jurtina]|uniref:uncharacterized protein LOC123872797 n=1 Tax=Maniola jurtina TaxID=191418 RepID=UPI001E686611|nr:uncharacterized protein LOC123872797 [Maniola jurtina]
MVARRRTKRLAVRKSGSSDLNDDIDMMGQTQENEKIEVSVTSKEILPKQMALAKLLRSENILSILSIKYKSPFKVLIEFGDKENAHKLLSNKRFAEADYRCQLTEGLQMIFGVVRNIDLDVQEEEMLASFESEFEILSIKRLRRCLDNGDWIESESVRVCFKSPTLPSYILIYGCRFKVEPFTFPVTQCSSCWRYGHTKKFCPRKKDFCPKCGEQHSNCETKIYSCINCNGNHMALERMSCPVFLKEKEIRRIMCEENCKYRQALLIYYDKKKLSDRRQRYNMNETNEEFNNRNVNYNETNLNKTYRDVLVTEAEIHNEKKEESSDSEIEMENIETVQTGSQKEKKRKKKGSKVERVVGDTEYIAENTEREKRQGENREEYEKKRKTELMVMVV